VNAWKKEIKKVRKDKQINQCVEAINEREKE
jgi:hypothetical protein